MRIIARSVVEPARIPAEHPDFHPHRVQLSGIVARLTDYSVVELFFLRYVRERVAIFVRFAWVYPAPICRWC